VAACISKLNFLVGQAKGPMMMRNRRRRQETHDYFQEEDKQ